MNLREYLDNQANTKCESCIHYKVCDKWWDLASVIDLPPSELNTFVEMVAEEIGCELYEF